MAVLKKIEKKSIRIELECGTQTPYQLSPVWEKKKPVKFGVKCPYREDKVIQGSVDCLNCKYNRADGIDTKEFKIVTCDCVAASWRARFGENTNTKVMSLDEWIHNVTAKKGGAK